MIIQQLRDQNKDSQPGNESIQIKPIEQYFL
uniref:Uncharacterized protein n=1 Tax=Rhizophora mucronata TaxID=61149 RepID=A0A2P2QFS5_RHIMU